MAVSHSCLRGELAPIMMKTTAVYDYDDERLPELCGIRIQHAEGDAEVCPALCMSKSGNHVPRSSAAPGPSTGAPASSVGPQAAPEGEGEGQDDDDADWTVVGPEGCGYDEGLRLVRCDGCDKEFLHLLTHKPADPIHCETCMIAKSRTVKKNKGSFKKGPGIVRGPGHV